MAVNQKKIKVDSKRFYKLLSDLYHKIAKTHTLKEALFMLIDLTTTMIGCERGTIFLNDKKTNELFSYVMKGKVEHEIRVANDVGLIGWTFKNKQALFVEDVASDSRFNPHIDQLTGYKTKSVLCVPMISITDEIVGVCELLNKLDNNFDEDDIKLVMAMTKEASLVIQSKLVLEHNELAHKREIEFLEAMSNVSTEIHLSKLLENIIHTVSWALDAERATLFINDEKNNELYTEASIGLEKKEIRFQNTLGIAGSAFTSGKIIHIPYAYADLRFNPSFDKSTGFFTRSILAAPVKNKSGKIIGVTQVLNKRSGQFTQDDISQLVAINAQISMAIENAKLFDDVQNIKNYNESILESMTNGVITLNEDNHIVTCNQAFLKLFQFQNLEKIINQDVYLFFEKSNAMLAEKIISFNKAKDKSKQESLVDVDLQINGSNLSANIVIQSLVGANQDWLGTMLMIEDISNEKRMKSTMSRYMNPDLAEQLMKSSEYVMGGTSTEASVLFSDIRNFTNLSESLGAEGTVHLLNEYFSAMVDCIQDEGGILDKFIGDAIMAVFGTPFTHEDDPDRAVRAAIAMMKKLMIFNQDRAKRHQLLIQHGIGINSEMVVSGNIGSEKRMDYTVIGDGVNLASRIEGLCKTYGAQLLISEFTFQKLKATYRTRIIDKVIVKGKNKPVSIYEVIDYHDDQSFPDQIEVLSHFNNGVEYYHRQNWDKAISCFQAALTLFPDDKPSTVYLERCHALKKNPPAADWSGVWVMTQK